MRNGDSRRTGTGVEGPGQQEHAIGADRRAGLAHIQGGDSLEVISQGAGPVMEFGGGPARSGQAYHDLGRAGDWVTAAPNLSIRLLLGAVEPSKGELRCIRLVWLCGQRRHRDGEGKQWHGRHHGHQSVHGFLQSVEWQLEADRSRQVSLAHLPLSLEEGRGLPYRQVSWLTDRCRRAPSQGRLMARPDSHRLPFSARTSHLRCINLSGVL